MVSVYDPAAGMMVGGFAKWFSYAKWLWIPAIPLAIFLVIWLVKKVRAKESQWTHTLKVRRVLPGGRLTDPVILRMRRFPLIKRAEVFELEKPFLGSRLIPELDEYSGDNEFSIILDTNNRIYTNKGEFFNPDKSSVFVSAKHSEIDIERSTLKADFQDINKISKRLEWATIAKYAFFVMLIMGVVVLGITGMSKWSEAQGAKAEEAHATASAMASLEKVMIVIAATVNTQKLQITPMLKELYGTDNLQSIINEEVAIIEQEGS